MFIKTADLDYILKGIKLWANATNSCVTISYSTSIVILSTICIFVLLLIFISKNFVNILILVVFFFVCIHIFLIFLNCEFLAVFLLIIYAGALAIFFLLSVLLLNLANPKLSESLVLSRLNFFFFLLVLLLYYFITQAIFIYLDSVPDSLNSVLRGPFSDTFNANFVGAVPILSIYSTFYTALFLLGVIMLVGMFSCVTIVGL